MTFRSNLSRTSTVVLGACLLVLPLSCINSNTKGTGTGTHTGGTGSLGSQATSGANSGGAGGDPLETAGGSAAATTLPDIDCTSVIECKPAKLLCDITRAKCVECLLDFDCRDGSACVSGICGGTVGCTTSDDCANSTTGTACDVQRGRCVGCVTADDCPDPEKSECANNSCRAITRCTNSLDCTATNAQVCDTVASPTQCVQCVIDADCKALGAGDTCANNLCASACTATEDCASGLKCIASGTSNYCAQCAQHADCAAAQYCNQGSCVADICVAGVDQACINGGIAACNEDGDGFGAPVACSTEQSCTAVNSRATCGSGSTGCLNNPGTVDPCSSIPQFTGTQTVDGKGDDFCNVPSFNLTFANAAGVNNNKVTSGSTSDFVKYAVARVAWSADAFHAYVEVFGKPVRSNSAVDRIWDGDSVELMVTTNSSASGLTSQDDQALHVIANNTLGVTVKSNADSGTHTQIVDASKIAVSLSDNGYAIELKLPWPGSPALGAGAAVRFDMALNVDTESVDPDVWGRDAQAVLAMSPLSGSSTCSSSEPTPFCDERLWCLTALK